MDETVKEGKDGKEKVETEEIEDKKERGEPSKEESRPKNQQLEQSPRKGPTLSTSTSSFEALDPHDPQLDHLASTMFSKTADWIAGELEITSAEYQLLEKMNRVTLTKYTDMRQVTQNVSKGVVDLNSKYVELQPVLEQIDQIDESVSRLEQAAYKLDAYSKRLEAKFKSLESRN